MNEIIIPCKKIVSIDVGISRLAFCLFINSNPNPTQYTIHKWAIVNLTKTSDTVITCSLCDNIAKYEKACTKYCTKHCKKTPGILPSPELKPGKINKLKLADLISLANKYNISYSAATTIKKTDLVGIVHQYIKENGFQLIEKTNASALDLNVIGRNIKENFNALFADDIDDICEVVIENQLSPMAIRMKTIQGMISQYFIMKNDKICIRFVNASNKLKGIAVTEDMCAPEDYKDRKDLSIHTCKQIINSDTQYVGTVWPEFINQKRKKDGIADLADCFLQGLWHIANAK
jgi:hypothetical protein